MTAPEALGRLAERVEREEPSAELWMAAFEAVHPVPRGEPWEAQMAWLEEDQRMKLLLSSKAWRDAAAMMMPEGWELDYLDQTSDQIEFGLRRFDPEESQYVVGRARGPHAEARARLAAALRARAAGAGG